LGPLSTTAGVSEYRFAEIASVSQTAATRGAARIARRGPSGIVVAPCSQGRRGQTLFRAQSLVPHPEAAARGHPHRRGCRRGYR
jgi:hypothetical protein